jgi:hypothetical protein
MNLITREVIMENYGLKMILWCLSLISGFTGQPMQAAQETMSYEQRTQINTVIEDVVKFADSTINWFNDFLSTRNNDSYNTHVNRLQDSLADFEANVVSTIRSQRSLPGIQGQLAKAIDEIIAPLLQQAKTASSILEKNRSNKNGASLGLALLPLQKFTAPTAINSITKKLEQLLKLVQQEQLPASTKISFIIDQLHRQAKTNSIGPVQALQGLNHRVKC